MDLLEIDLEVMIQAVQKFASSSTLEDHLVTKAMQSRNEWRTQATALSKKILEVNSAINQWALTELEAEALAIQSRVKFNQTQLTRIIEQVEKFDANMGLYSDRPAKSCPTKLPTFEGQDHEDLITFKDKFNLAAENNKISKTDQVEKLREVLTGNALSHLTVDGITDIELAWEYVDQAFSNPHTCLNHRLAKVKSMPGLTDNIEQTQPGYAADWYLKMESAVDSVLRMGTRNQSLEYVAFNNNTIYNITSKLPWKLESQAYEYNSKDIYGKAKLTKVLELIKRARSVAHSRATDQSNMEP